MRHEIDLEDIYEEFQPKILNYISRLAGHYEAEDLAQEVFEKVSRGLVSFKGESKLSTWLPRPTLDRLLVKRAIYKVNSFQFTRLTRLGLTHQDRQDVQDEKYKKILLILSKK